MSERRNTRKNPRLTMRTSSFKQDFDWHVLKNKMKSPRMFLCLFYSFLVRCHGYSFKPCPVCFLYSELFRCHSSVAELGPSCKGNAWETKQEEKKTGREIGEKKGRRRKSFSWNTQTPRDWWAAAFWHTKKGFTMKSALSATVLAGLIGGHSKKV